MNIGGEVLIFFGMPRILNSLDNSRWKLLVGKEEASSCIVNSQPFKDATNPYAVRNLLLHMHREKKIKIQDPPDNSQMRFGYYKSALLFIGQ